MKLGIIGMGRRMGGLLPHFRQKASDLTVCGVVDANPEAARSWLPEEVRDTVVFFETMKELVERTKPDALAIATRCDSHAALAAEAASYGLPLFLEKPVATTMAQAKALEAAFQNSQSEVLVSFPLRASSLCRRAKRSLETGAVGRLDHVLATNYVTYGSVYFETWFRDYSVVQGLFLQKATHDFDYLSYLAESPITRVGAMISRGRVYRDTSTRDESATNDALYYDDIGTPESGMNEDSSSALLEFANGLQGVYTQVFFSKRAPQRGARISGIEGLLEFDWYQNSVKVTRHREDITEFTTLEDKDSHFGGDVELADNFIQIIRGTARSLAPIETGLRSVYACLAAKESASTGRFIDVRKI